jgi:hypothetical protein
VGGRIAISDIVSDEPVPDLLKADPELWSGCVSGAFQERALLAELEAAGFHGMRIETWADEPCAVVQGIEFRSVTVTAHKAKQGPCFETNQAVVYRGPWRRVEDDDGHVLVRGERTAVCEKTFRLLRTEPYAHETVPVPSRIAVDPDGEQPFDCARPRQRDPRETKGEAYRATQAPACGPGESCRCATDAFAERLETEGLGPLHRGRVPQTGVHQDRPPRDGFPGGISLGSRASRP